jgi:serine/threonine-protein kinase
MPSYMLVRQGTPIAAVRAMRRDVSTLATSDAVPLPPVPGLRIVRCLGRGGMGAVYLAVRRDSHHTVALKVITAGGPSDPDARARFHREIDAVSSIHHPNVVRFLTAGAAGGIPYALFERVRGQSMAEIGPQPWPVVVDLAGQLARATAAVHAAGWIHRDLKRSNVMVGDRGLVTLIDFGLAKHPDLRGRAPHDAAQADTLTVPGTVAGTRRYLSPEVRRGRSATFAADMFALGLAMHELLGGTVDAEGRLTAIPCAIPSALSDVIERLLSEEPGRRPSALALAGALGTLAATRGTFRIHDADHTSTWPFAADLRATQTG